MKRSVASWFLQSVCCHFFLYPARVLFAVWLIFNWTLILLITIISHQILFFRVWFLSWLLFTNRHFIIWVFEGLKIWKVFFDFTDLIRYTLLNFLHFSQQLCNLTLVELPTNAYFFYSFWNHLHSITYFL